MRIRSLSRRVLILSGARSDRGLVVVNKDSFTGVSQLEARRIIVHPPKQAAMPVKIENQEQPDACPTITTDIDFLVKHVQESLCLKNRDKLHSYRKTPYSASHRAGHGYGRNSNVCNRNSSPTSSGGYFSNRLKRCCKNSDVLKSEDDNPHILLQKLLQEQTLIQEAVRRLQCRTSLESENKQSFRNSWNESACDTINS